MNLFRKLTIRLSVLLVIVVSALSLICCKSEDTPVDDMAIVYTDPAGKSFPVHARPGQAMVTFANVSETQQQHIIARCGGEIIEHYPLLRTYLVKTSPGKEMEFVTTARSFPDVMQARLNTIADPMGMDVHFIDDFTTTIDHGDEPFKHGDYCYESALSAYPENARHLVLARYDTKGDFSDNAIVKYLNEIFSSTHRDSLILINMSFGPRVFRVGVVEGQDTVPQYMRDDTGRIIRIPWHETFEGRYGHLEREWWADRYIDGIRTLAEYLIILSETNPNHIVFKSSGNCYCHEIDKYVFNALPSRLTKKELEVVRNHVIHVAAKDDDRAVDGCIYADYANTPVSYNPFLTMTDISHLKHDGTSFSTPFLLGLVAQRFDEKGYKPLGARRGNGYTVLDMMNHIRNTTGQYARNVSQPGLYTVAYCYDRRYTFTGTLMSDVEDLCETGIPETYYYIEIPPIDINVNGLSETDEPLAKVTRLQIDNYDPSMAVGRRVTVSGDLTFNIAGCHIHTDAYLINCVVGNN